VCDFPYPLLELMVAKQMTKRAEAAVSPAEPSRTLLYGPDGVSPVAQVPPVGGGRRG